MKHDLQQGVSFDYTTHVERKERTSSGGLLRKKADKMFPVNDEQVLTPIQQHRGVSERKVFQRILEAPDVRCKR